MKKIISIVLALTLLSSTCVFAVPADLWEGNDRVTGIFAQKEVEISNFDIIQELIAYVGVADKEDIAGEAKVNATVILRALCQITGIYYDENTDNKTLIEALKQAKFLRSDAKASLLSLQDLLYAAARITGWAETIDNDGTVYANAKKAGLLTNIAYSTGRALTKSEAAQLIYNILAVNQKIAIEYSPTYVSLDKEVSEPILQSKYGIVMKEGIVTSVFGESVYHSNSAKSDEIEIDFNTYKLAETTDTVGLVGRDIVYFFEVESNTVLFAETTTKNNVHIINYGEEPKFTANLIEYESKLTEEEYELEVDASTKVIYNGLLAGNYTQSIMEGYFNENTNVTAIDNNDDGHYEYLLVRRWESFVVDSGAGSSGVFSLAYEKTYNGSNSFDVTPDDKQLHVIVTSNGQLADASKIKDNTVVSFSATENTSGHRYVLIDVSAETVQGVLGAMYDNYYVVDETDYPVSSVYLTDMETNYDIKKPVLGQSYTFYVDVTGKIVGSNATGGDYAFGYLVKVTQSRASIDAKYTVKLFTSNAKMEEYPIAEKLMVYDGNNPAGGKVTPAAFVQRLVDNADNGDYRCLIQYKLKSGELAHVWFAQDNVVNGAANGFGTVPYQFTKDVENSTHVYYTSGLISYDTSTGSTVSSSAKFWGKDTILFAIPDDKDAPDGKYTIKSVSYNGSRWTEPTTFYCVDDWNIIPVAIMHMGAEAGIDNYSAVYAVSRVVAAINPITGENCYRVYGTHNGVEKSFLIAEDVASDPGKAGWLGGVTATDLKFGDLVQISTLDGAADALRIVYRHGGLADDMFMSNGGVDIAGQLEIRTGTFGGKRNAMYKFIQTVGGVETPSIKQFTANKSITIVDLSTKKLSNGTFADLQLGDKIVEHSKWGTMVNTYVYRE